MKVKKKKRGPGTVSHQHFPVRENTMAVCHPLCWIIIFIAITRVEVHDEDSRQKYLALFLSRGRVQSCDSDPSDSWLTLTFPANDTDRGLQIFQDFVPVRAISVIELIKNSWM